MAATKSCSISGCAKRHLARSWCSLHYQAWKRHGHPLAGGRKYADPEEAFAARTEWRGECLVWNGATDRLGYTSIQVAGTVRSAHRYAWEREHGPIPAGKYVDHSCHNPSCVNVEHLRLATPQENSRNKRGARSDNPLGVRGVFMVGDRYGARVNNVYLGVFDTLEAAASTAASTAAEWYGEFAGNYGLSDKTEVGKVS